MLKNNLKEDLIPIKDRIQDYVQIGDVYLYPVRVPDTEYKTKYKEDKGTPIYNPPEAEMNYKDMSILLSQQVFNMGAEAILEVMIFMHHGHPKPMNYSTILMQQRILWEKRERKYVEENIVKPRLNKSYLVGTIIYPHHSELTYIIPKQPKETDIPGQPGISKKPDIPEQQPRVLVANAWIVSTQPPDAMLTNAVFSTSTLCFSENDAKQAADNLNKFMKINGKECLSIQLSSMPSLSFFESNNIELIKFSIVKMQSRKTKLINDINKNQEICDRIIELSNGKIKTLDENTDINTLLAALQKYIVTDLVNHHSNQDITHRIFKFISSIELLNTRYAEFKTLTKDQVNIKDSDSIDLKNDLTNFHNDVKNETKNILSPVNEPLLNAVELYIKEKISAINKVCAKEEMNFNDMKKIVMQFLVDIKQVDFNSLYLSINKNGQLFKSDKPASLSDVRKKLDDKLKIENINTYAKDILAKPDGHVPRY